MSNEEPSKTDEGQSSLTVGLGEAVIYEQWAIYFRGSPFGDPGWVHSGRKLRLFDTEEEAAHAISGALRDHSLYRPVRVHIRVAPNV